MFPRVTRAAVVSNLSDQRRWRIVLNRDRRYDGAFVYAVRSTGIYCRPSCPSKRPRREQVRFFLVPEIAEQAREFSEEVILDGEIIAFAEDRKLTFFDLQKRLGRKTDALDLFETSSADVPVIFVAFDLLFLDGRSLLRTALRERRELRCVPGDHVPVRGSSGPPPGCRRRSE